jgi:phenylalanine-4-hydroxylase
LTELVDKPGALHEVLKYFWKYDIDLTRIESRPNTKLNDQGFKLYIDFAGNAGDENVKKLIEQLKAKCHNMLVLDDREVPWFPHHISELDKIANKTLDASSGDLVSDHPGFNDEAYLSRRRELAKIAHTYTSGEKIPYIDYQQDEIKTWGIVYNKLKTLQKKYACPEYLEIIPRMEQRCGYSPDRIPQAQDISDFLQAETGFRLRPVAGLLSSRDFLNGLAFRTFFSTQYIRHPSEPLYTPEPDICHELLGHAPMFADPDFADFSQEIGLASLGASDDVITKLAACYWHSVEFGVLESTDADGDGDGDVSGPIRVKAYGAGLLSSFGELEYACNGSTDDGNEDPDQGGTSKDSNQTVRRPTFLPWDPVVASKTTFPITTYQPTYFVAKSLLDAKLKMRAYCGNLPRPFYARYNSLTDGIWVDRAVRLAVDEEHHQ